MSQLKQLPSGCGTHRAGPWQGGWHADMRRVSSDNFGPRPEGVSIDLIVVHSISLPPGEYGGSAIEEFFTNRLDWDAHPYFQIIRGVKVSAHFLIRRDGICVQFVSVQDRAWHAGVSQFQGRDNCNDYSVGIELEGLEGGVFEQAQYQALAELCGDLKLRWPIQSVTGHDHVSPGRKFDPGTSFDWKLLRAKLGWPGRCFPVSPT
jgi:N-acetyl-anhydromuramyl-L-alanine amidase AmpD